MYLDRAHLTAAIGRRRRRGVPAAGGGGDDGFEDTFTRTADLDASSSDSGHTWTVHAGTFDTDGARCVLTGTVESYATIDFEVADFDYQLTMAVTRDAGRSSRIVARYTDANNHLMIQHDNSAVTFLLKRVASAYTILVTGTGNGADGDDIRLTCDGSDLELFKNTVSQGTASDAAHSTVTRLGLGAMADAGGNTLEWDDAIATAL